MGLTLPLWKRKSWGRGLVAVVLPCLTSPVSAIRWPEGFNISTFHWGHLWSSAYLKFCINFVVQSLDFKMSLEPEEKPLGKESKECVSRMQSSCLFEFLPLQVLPLQWHFLQWPCTSDSLGCLDQLEAGTKFLAAGFQRFLLIPLRAKGLFSTYQKGLGRRQLRYLCEETYCI